MFLTTTTTTTMMMMMVVVVVVVVVGMCTVRRSVYKRSKGRCHVIVIVASSFGARFSTVNFPIRLVSK